MEIAETSSAELVYRGLFVFFFLVFVVFSYICLSGQIQEDIEKQKKEYEEKTQAKEKTKKKNIPEDEDFSIEP